MYTLPGCKFETANRATGAVKFARISYLNERTKKNLILIITDVEYSLFIVPHRFAKLSQHLDRVCDCVANLSFFPIMNFWYLGFSRNYSAGCRMNCKSIWSIHIDAICIYLCTHVTHFQHKRLRESAVEALQASYPQRCHRNICYRAVVHLIWTTCNLHSSNWFTSFLVPPYGNFFSNGIGIGMHLSPNCLSTINT